MCKAPVGLGANLTLTSFSMIIFYLPATAIHEISTFASLGSLLTSTVSLAGGLETKYSPYILFIVAKLFKSLTKMLHFTTFEKFIPASVKTACIFFITCWV